MWQLCYSNSGIFNICPFAGVAKMFHVQYFLLSTTNTCLIHVSLHSVILLRTIDIIVLFFNN